MDDSMFDIEDGSDFEPVTVSSTVLEGKLRVTSDIVV